MYIKTRQAPDHVFAISPKGLAPQLRRNARTVADARNLLTSLGYVVLLHKGRRKGDASRYRYGTLADRRAHRVQNEYPIEHYTPAPSDEGQQ